MIVPFEPLEEFRFELPVRSVPQDTFFQNIAVPVDKLARNDNQTSVSGAVECLESLIKESGQFGRERLRASTIISSRG